VADPERHVLISLCQQVLAGQLWLDDLDRAWPEPVDNPALAPLREALEDAVEHTPGYWYHPGVNIRAWRRSPQYADG
jgi:hypothetical protein